MVPIRCWQHRRAARSTRRPAAQCTHEALPAWRAAVRAPAVHPACATTIPAMMVLGGAAAAQAGKAPHCQVKEVCSAIGTNFVALTDQGVSACVGRCSCGSPASALCNKTMVGMGCSGPSDNCTSAIAFAAQAALPTVPVDLRGTLLTHPWPPRVCRKPAVLCVPRCGLALLCSPCCPAQD